MLHAAKASCSTNATLAFSKLTVKLIFMVTIKGIRVKLVNYESCSDSFRSVLVCFNFQGSSSFLRGPRALLALLTSSISYLTYLV